MGLTYYYDDQIQAEECKYYSDKCEERYGSVGDGEYYAISARLTFKAAQEIIEGKELDGTSYEEKKKYSEEQIRNYYKKYGYNYNYDKRGSYNELEEIWCQTIFGNKYDIHNSMVKVAREEIMGVAEGITTKTGDQLSKEKNETQGYSSYVHPKVSKTETDIDTDQTIQNADNFINTKDDNNPNNNINTSELSEFFNPIYNIALIIGIIVAVIVGAILGIKFMTGSVEQKADTKKLLIPYVAGCIVVFGAFGIWKIVVTILAGI